MTLSLVIMYLLYILLFCSRPAYTQYYCPNFLIETFLRFLLYKFDFFQLDAWFKAISTRKAVPELKNSALVCLSALDKK